MRRGVLAGTVHVQRLWRLKSVVCLGRVCGFCEAGRGMLSGWEGGR